MEKGAVSYTIKLCLTSKLWERISRGVLWRRLASDTTIHIEAGSVGFRASNWTKHRRGVLIRTRMAEVAQLNLFPEYAWDYEAIVTNLDWAEEDIWHFYNQRCTCENHIKELKYGLRVDAISKAKFWPNAADLWVKVIAYNIRLALRGFALPTYRHYSIGCFRRALLRVPALLVHHARQWKLRLPAYWPHQRAWQHLRTQIQTG